MKISQPLIGYFACFINIVYKGNDFPDTILRLCRFSAKRAYKLIIKPVSRKLIPVANMFKKVCRHLFAEILVVSFFMIQSANGLNEFKRIISWPCHYRYDTLLATHFLQNIQS